MGDTIPRSLFGLDVGTVVVWVIFLLGAIGGLYKMWRILRPIAKKVDEFFDDWNGEKERPGVPGRRGVMERLDTIEHEVTFNNGSSVKDSAQRTEKSVARIEKSQDDLKTQLADHLTEAAKEDQRRASVEVELRQAIRDLSEALPVVARSTPDEQDTTTTT